MYANNWRLCYPTAVVLEKEDRRQWGVIMGNNGEWGNRKDTGRAKDRERIKILEIRVYVHDAVFRWTIEVTNHFQCSSIVHA